MTELAKAANLLLGLTVAQLGPCSCSVNGSACRMSLCQLTPPPSNFPAAKYCQGISRKVLPLNPAENEIFLGFSKLLNQMRSKLPGQPVM